MSPVVKDFLVYVIELCDTSHTLSSGYILEEIKERFMEHGIIFNQLEIHKI